MQSDLLTFRISKVDSDAYAYAYESEPSASNSTVIFLQSRLEDADADAKGKEPRYAPVDVTEIRLPALEEKQEGGDAPKAAAPTAGKAGGA
jgi:hypothetical protein